MVLGYKLTSVQMCIVLQFCEFISKSFIYLIVYALAQTVTRDQQPFAIKPVRRIGAPRRVDLDKLFQ